MKTKSYQNLFQLLPAKSCSLIIGVILFSICHAIHAQVNVILDEKNLNNYYKLGEQKWSEKEKVEIINDIQINIEAHIDTLSSLDEIEIFIKEDLTKWDFISCLQYLYLGKIASNNYQDKESIELFKEGISCNETSPHDYLLAQFYFKKGVSEDYDQQFSASLESFHNALKIYRTLGFKENEISCLNSLGVVNKRFEKFDKAIEYYKTALAVANSDDKFIYNRMLINNNLGQTYRDLGKLDTAIMHMEEAIVNCEDKSPKGKYRILLSTLGSCYILKGNINKGLDLKNESLELTRLGGNKATIVAYEIEYAYYLSTINRKEQAKTLLLDADKTLKKYNLTQLRKQYYATAKEVFKASGEFEKAYNHYQVYVAIRDSQLNENTQSKYLELQEKFETKEKEAMIIAQESEINEQRSQRNLFMSFGGILSLIGLFLWNRLKLNRKIYIQETELNTQKITQLEKEKKILAMSAMIEGQEAERIRIAKDLHDGIGGLLSTVKAHFSNIQAEVEKVNKIKVYDKTNELIDRASSEVRRISHNLMPGALRLDGLHAAIEQIAEDLDTAHAINVRAEIIAEDEPSDEQTQVYLFRIIQEASNNVIKYAEAKNYLIQFSSTENEYHLILEDDGKGFDASDISKLDGLGLKSIKSRVEQLNGVLDIDAKEGEGTSLSIHIPKSGIKA